MAEKMMDSNVPELKEKVVTINRVAKVVKGGRTFRFSALVVVGDENGHVGCGMGKAAEIPEAVRKGIEDAKKNMISFPMAGTTITHEIVGKFGAGTVLAQPRLVLVQGLSQADRFVRSWNWLAFVISERNPCGLTIRATW